LLRGDTNGEQKNKDREDRKRSQGEPGISHCVPFGGKG
jgi:hypothetical protein